MAGVRDREAQGSLVLARVVLRSVQSLYVLLLASVFHSK